jgi:ribonuclease HI
LCTGAILGTTKASLQVELGEKPLGIRWAGICATTWMKRRMSGHTQSYTRKRSDNLNGRKKLKVAMDECAANQNILTGGVPIGLYPLFSKSEPWKFQKLSVKLAVTGLVSKNEVPVSTVKQCVLSMLDLEYPGHLQVYTDGSRNVERKRTAGAIIIPQHNQKLHFRLADYHTIHTAEMCSISQALVQLLKKPPQKVVILSDSMSVLTQLGRPKSIQAHSFFLWQAITNHQLLVNRGWQIKFQWIPGHSGVQGNESADRAAKRGLDIPLLEETITMAGPGEASAIIRENVKEMWQNQWDRESDCFLYQLKSMVNEKPLDVHPNRRADVIFTRLRLGKFPTNEWRMRFLGEGNGLCPECGLMETIPHVLLECVYYQQQRHVLRRQIGEQNLTMQNLLGGEVDNPKMRTLAVWKFIMQSLGGRLCN